MATPDSDPDMLTIRRGLRLLKQRCPERFEHHARGLALLLHGDPDSAFQRECNRVAQNLEQIYPRKRTA